MDIKDEISKALDTLSDEALAGVLEYIRFTQEPEEVEPTPDEIQAIARGKTEIAQGQVVKWRDISPAQLLHYK